jgi:hypothetical protein
MVWYVLLRPLRSELDGQDQVAGHQAPASEFRRHNRAYLTILKREDHALFKMVRYIYPPATSEAGARRPAIKCKL